MTIKELINRLQNAIDHGANPESKVFAFDSDSEQWEEVSVLVFDPTKVLIYTDET